MPYLYDNVYKQIEVYEKINKITDKLKYIDDILEYYKTTNYISIDKELCINYWKQKNDYLDFILFRYY